MPWIDRDSYETPTGGVVRLEDSVMAYGTVWTVARIAENAGIIEIDLINGSTIMRCSPRGITTLVQ